LISEFLILEIGICPSRKWSGAPFTVSKGAGVVFFLWPNAGERFFPSDLCRF
jgi:hypothetical protein